MYTSSGLKMYRNNSQLAASGNNYWSGTNGFCIGNKYSETGNPFTGDIHGIRIYNRTLTNDELLMNWQYDQARYGITV